MSLGEIQENVITEQQTETNARLQLPDLKILSHFNTAMNGKYFPKITATLPISPLITFYLKFWEMEEFWGGDGGGDTPVSVTQATPRFLACGARDTRMSCLSMAVCNSFF